MSNGGTSMRWRPSGLGTERSSREPGRKQGTETRTQLGNGNEDAASIDAGHGNRYQVTLCQEQRESHQEVLYTTAGTGRWAGCTCSARRLTSRGSSASSLKRTSANQFGFSSSGEHWERTTFWLGRLGETNSNRSWLGANRSSRRPASESEPIIGGRIRPTTHGLRASFTHVLISASSFPAPVNELRPRFRPTPLPGGPNSLATNGLGLCTLSTHWDDVGVAVHVLSSF